MLTVWYSSLCPKGQKNSSMLGGHNTIPDTIFPKTKKPVWYFSLEEARRVTVENVRTDAYCITAYPNGWIEVWDHNNNVVHTTRKTIKQLSLWSIK